MAVFYFDVLGSGDDGVLLRDIDLHEFNSSRWILRLEVLDGFFAFGGAAATEENVFGCIGEELFS